LTSAIFLALLPEIISAKLHAAGTRFLIAGGANPLTAKLDCIGCAAEIAEIELSRIAHEGNKSPCCPSLKFRRRTILAAPRDAIRCGFDGKPKRRRPCRV
jgi:hypothetical protein